jgi:hypothetical protein
MVAQTMVAESWWQFPPVQRYPREASRDIDFLFDL